MSVFRQTTSQYRGEPTRGCSTNSLGQRRISEGLTSAPVSDISSIWHPSVQCPPLKTIKAPLSTRRRGPYRRSRLRRSWAPHSDSSSFSLLTPTGPLDCSDVTVVPGLRKMMGVKERLRFAPGNMIHIVSKSREMIVKAGCHARLARHTPQRGRDGS